MFSYNHICVRRIKLYSSGVERLDVVEDCNRYLPLGRRKPVFRHSAFNRWLMLN